MDFIPLLRLRKNALKDCTKTDDLPLERRNKIEQNLKILQTAPWITKAVIAFGIVFGVDWKKAAPISKREIPLALGAVAFCAISDYLVSDYVWKQHEVEVVRLTGFKNGVYVSPQRMKRMRAKMLIENTMAEFDDDLVIQNDEA